MLTPTALSLGTPGIDALGQGLPGAKWNVLRTKWFRRSRRCVVLLGAIVLEACGDHHPRRVQIDSSSVRGGGSATIAFHAEPNHVVGPLERLDVDSWLGALVGISLAVQVVDAAGTHWAGSREHGGALASRWEVLGDSSAIRFHLDPRARWSDGAPITAADVAFTFRLIADSTFASPAREPSLGFDSVATSTDSTVTLYFRRRSWRMMTLAKVRLLPRHVFQNVRPSAIEQHPAARQPGRLVTGGFYRITSWVRGDRLILERNPYAAHKPRLERLVIRILPEESSREAEAANGTLDFLQLSPVATSRLRRAHPRLQVLNDRARSFEYLGYNPAGHPALRSSVVRRCLGQAIDVPAMIVALDLVGFASVSSGPYRALSDGLPPLRYDPDRSRACFEASGWRDVDGDGIREKDGVPLRLTLLTNANARRRDAAVLIQRYWRSVGVDARVEVREMNTLWSQLERRSFQVELGGWAVPVPLELKPLFAPDGAYNFVDFSDSIATREMGLAEEAATEADALLHLRNATVRIVDGQPYTFLFDLDQVFVASPRLRGVKLGDTPFSNVQDWEVSNGR